MLTKKANFKTAIYFKRSISIKNYSTRPSYIHNVGQEPLCYLTVGSLLQQTANKFPERKALIAREQNRSLTFQEVLNQADKLAAAFKTLGLQGDDRVGIWAPNLIEWYITYMACARAGLILVGLNPAYTPPEIEYCINKVHIRTIVCGDSFKKQDFYESLVSLAPELPQSTPGKLKSQKIPSLETIITVCDREKRGTFNFDEVLNLANIKRIEEISKNQYYLSPDSPFNIQFTSGTTGKPKATVTSHFNIVNNGFYIGKRNEQSLKHHVICMQVPFFHAFGTIVSTMASLNHGSTLVLPSSTYNPNKSLDAITEEKCTMIHGTPTMYVDLIHCQEQRNEDISPEIAVSGGSLCSPHLFQKMVDILKVKKVKSVYGLSETTAVVFQNVWPESIEQATTTVGQVGEHVEAKIVDQENRVVPFGTPGELCVRGYANMLGYWSDEEKTKEMILPDGWLRTGDQFVLEEDGYGKVVGRIKDMIIRGGENIYPKEIENFLNTHPSVLEAQVGGVPHERLGEEVCAFVRVKPDCSITLEEIKQFCKGHLSDYKIPAYLEVRDDFPKTASGKIQKYLLIQSFCNK